MYFTVPAKLIGFSRCLSGEQSELDFEFFGISRIDIITIKLPL